MSTLDTAAFNKVMAAHRMPRRPRNRPASGSRPRRRHARGHPNSFEVLRKCDLLVDLAERAVKKGNRNSLSDAGAVALAARAAAEGAWYNVRINSFPD